MTDYEGLGTAFKHYLEVAFLSTMAFPFFGTLILISLENIPSWFNPPPITIPAIGLISLSATFLYRVRKGYADTIKQEATFAFVSITSIGLTVFYIMVIFAGFAVPVI